MSLLDEDRATVLERLDNMLVVDDLLANVYRSAILLERALNGLYRSINAGAVATGGGEKDPLAHP